MRMYSTLIAGALGLALAAGATTAQAQSSWGPSHTTYWNSDSTGKFEPGQFMQQSTQPTAQPAGTQLLQDQPRQKRMFYQAPNKRAQMRLRQQQPGTKPMKPGDPAAAPPAERGAQPPGDVKPSAPPTQGEPPKQSEPPAQGQPK